MLHLVFQSLFAGPVLERIAGGDDVVFFENALFGLLKGSRQTDGLPDCDMFVLSDDLNARGIAAEELAPGVTVIDDATLVELTVKNQTIQTWC